MRQFRLNVGALEEQALASGREERFREGQEFGQRRKAAGGDEGGWRQVCRLDADSVHVDRGAGDPRGLAKESSLALVGLDQVEGHVCGKGENEPREAGTGA